VKDPLEEAGSDVTRRGAGVSLLLVLLGLILLAILRPSTIDTLAIIFGIVALIMLHEAGHYFTAKRAGMKVTEFFLGFGPRVWSFRRGETEYGVKAIPAGGYVRIVGMSNLEDIDPDEEPRTFRHGTFGNRLTVILAGVTVNLILAFVLIYAALIGRGLPDTLQAQVSRVLPDSPAAAAGVQNGDRIISIDGRRLDVDRDIAQALHDRVGQPTTIVVKRDGGTATLTVVPKERSSTDNSGIIGVSVDAQGHTALRMALQTREQHIRREKATSNICTAQVLLAVIAAMYAAYHGPDGLAAIARRVHRRAAVLARTLHDQGFITSSAFFDTVRAIVPGDAAEAVARARAAGYNVHAAGADAVQIACDETTTEAQLREVAGALAGREVELADGVPDALPAGLRRDSEFLTHPVFSSYRSETAMLRYLRRLADFDVALDRSMIPLGSCTMKLNAAAEMEPVTWPEFAQMHPFAPAGQAEGYLEVIAGLEHALKEITGYDAVSLQPNAGSQGELAGLLAIRAYHRSRQEPHRTVCLIPESAHGTNAASAVLAGLRVVVVTCGPDGAIDLGDLRAKLDAHAGALAAIMLTYPSTNGVFEETIGQVCAEVHAAGGQVYVDGANLNALVGLARPGAFGADVSHLNLHKTFCIPHGGGGPGVGPVAVRSHLAQFLPAHPALRHPVLGGMSAADLDAGVLTPGEAAEGGLRTGPVAAAPYGSAGILPISWAYIAMMGADGLRQASQVAILSANYLARRLDPHFPVLYTGRDGLVAHECILDLRPLASQTGITAEDVAKRLIDYGLHAPTMSFPVAGTLMVEPTESEDLAELDRFCDAMIAIRREIARVAAGELDARDNPLKNAPHTASMLMSADWKHPYEREQAAYPVPGDRRAKYWPPVRRIDQAYGDRNLVCACPPPEAFAE